MEEIGLILGTESGIIVPERADVEELAISSHLQWSLQHGADGTAQT